MNQFSKWLGGRSLVVSALCAMAQVGYAHSGHPVPAGVPAQQHWHLLDQVVVSPVWLIVVGIASVALAVMVVKRERRRARTDD